MRDQKHRSPTAKPSAAPEQPPFIGALLHLCWQKVRARMFAVVQEAGYSDLLESHFAAFSYPLPDGVRPSDFARQVGMSRQAANYLVGQLERMGYLERRADRRGGRRLIYLTRKGWKVVDVMWSALRQIQLEWADEVGARRFADFMTVLRKLAATAQQQR